jgi:hypothetical protein
MQHKTGRRVMLALKQTVPLMTEALGHSPLC